MATRTSSKKPESAQDQLIEDIAGFYADPLGYVRYVFPWGEPGPLAGESGPDAWQTELLREVGLEVKKQETGELGVAIQEAVASGHGIGKSALVAWIIKWFMATRPFPQVNVTANTFPQLSTKTWRELAKWNRLALDGHWFKHTATRFYHVEHPDTWFAAAIPWSEHNSEAFAGAHERHVLVVFDEASAIADIIWEVAEGAMTTPGAMWFAFGNPTRNTGRFRECFGRFKHRWHTRQIDSRTAKKASLPQISQWVEDYGEDSDFVRIRVRGEFPRAGSNQFIASDVVEGCIKYKAEAYASQPRILGVDVARFGDDMSVLTRRQGRKVWPQDKFRGLDTMQLADKVVETIRDWDPQAVVVDGVGLGAGVVDRLAQLGYRRLLTEINGGSTPTDATTYYNRRAELWGLMRDALKAGVEIPNDKELTADLIGPEYGFTSAQKIQLEKKEDMKARGLGSPDCADSLSLTYAVTPAMPKPAPARDSRPMSWMGA